jgi:hypothetical protein
VAAGQPGAPNETEELAMNQLNVYLGRHEIDHRLREVDHRRRVRRVLTSRRRGLRTVPAAYVDR